MLTKTITYTNPFTDEEISEDHYFHLSKADLIEMEMEEHKDSYTSKSGEELTGLAAKLQRVMDSEDGRTIISEFKDIIRRAYGKKDGNRFLKSPEIWEDFSSSEAYSQFFFDFCTDAEFAAEFMNGIVPKNLDQIAAEIQKRAAEGQSGSTPAAVTDISTARASDAPEPRVLTPSEVAAMDSDELKSGIADGRYKLS